VERNIVAFLYLNIFAKETYQYLPFFKLSDYEIIFLPVRVSARETLLALNGFSYILIVEYFSKKPVVGTQGVLSLSQGK
jgi:hypothetical protein